MLRRLLLLHYFAIFQSYCRYLVFKVNAGWLVALLIFLLRMTCETFCDYWKQENTPDKLDT